MGGEAKAGELLGHIDKWLEGDKTLLPAMVARHVARVYGSDARYREAIGYLKEFIVENVDIDGVDIISGGARRDWYFSVIVAYIFRKPHLTIYKDLSMAVGDPSADADTNSNDEASGVAATPVRAGGLRGARCLHVSDIVTEASSYVRAWAPAVEAAGTRIHTSLTVLDRAQGGSAVLGSLGIRHLAPAVLDAGFFKRALSAGRVDEKQYERLIKYIGDPDGTMKAFLAENPNFLRDAAAAGGKEAERARMCVESGIYGPAARI